MFCLSWSLWGDAAAPADYWITTMTTPESWTIFMKVSGTYVPITQLAKFIGPMAGFHRHFHRPAVGNRCRADIGFAHRFHLSFAVIYGLP